MTRRRPANRRIVYEEQREQEDTNLDSIVENYDSSEDPEYEPDQDTETESDSDISLDDEETEGEYTDESDDESIATTTGVEESPEILTSGDEYSDDDEYDSMLESDDE